MREANFIGLTFPTTDGLELYGRNMMIHDNGNVAACPSNSPSSGITGFGFEGIGAHSLYKSTIANNYIHNNDTDQSTLTTGGIKLVTSFPTGPCGGVPRDTSTVSIAGNTISGQPYGIHFSDQGHLSTDSLSNVTLMGNNVMPTISGDIAMIDSSVALPGYGAGGPTPLTTGSKPLATPLALAVDSTSWQFVKCPATGVAGTQRATFTIPVKENEGASNVSWVEGVFSVGGADSDGSGGPTTDAGGCHFHWDNVGQSLYLDTTPGLSQWKPPSTLG